MADFRGGRGKKVTYETQMYRIPSPLRPTVERLGTQFRMLWDGLADPKGEKLISRIEAAIPDPEQLSQLDERNQISSKIQQPILDIKNKELESENSQLHMQVAELKNNAWLQDETIRNRTEENSQLRLQLDDMAARANEWHDRAKAAEAELEQLRLQPVVSVAVSPEAIVLLQKAVTPKTKGGSYAANNAIGLKKLVEQALALLIGANSQ